jgi:hypothetical protein
MASFKDGIFRLHTRRFGTVAELLVKRLINARESHDSKYDLEQGNTRIECKFSRAQQKSSISIRESTILQAILEEANRDVPYELCENVQWDCNFQQIKKDLFDVLYYGIFFSDCLVIYKINTKEIDGSIGYCDKQHRGNVGEGQFHINPRNIGLHDKYMYSILDYEEIEKCLTSH